MSVCPAIRSLEEIRQQLLSDAQDQVQRLQDPTLALTKRVLAEAAMGICERDRAIRLLQGIANGIDEQHFLYQSQSLQPQPTPAPPTPAQPNPSHPNRAYPIPPQTRAVQHEDTK